jgi:imidazolonepropionase-like amidohydrolase
LADAMPDLFLAYGITSLRDTGGEIEFVNSFKQKSIKNPQTTPRIKIAGPLVDGKYNVYNGSSPNYPALSIKTMNVEDLEKQVKSLIEKKVDFLKAYEMLNPKQFEAITEIAKKNNLKLTGHVPLSMDVITASNLGLNSMEHLRNIELSMSIHSDKLLKERKDILKNKNQIKGSQLRSLLHQKQRFKSVYSLDSTKVKKVVSVLAKNKTWQIPTLILYQNFVYKKYKDSSYTSSFDVLPKRKKEEWLNEIKGIPDDLNEDLKNYNEWTQKMVGYMNLNGVKFMAGTDVPIGYLIPGLSLHQELLELKKSGLSNKEVIQSATNNPAKYFNMNDSLGSIKIGYIADLIILDKNPLEDIENTQSINAVIKDGNYLNRNYLDSLLYKKEHH